MTVEFNAELLVASYRDGIEEERARILALLDAPETRKKMARALCRRTCRMWGQLGPEPCRSDFSCYHWEEKLPAIDTVITTLRAAIESASPSPIPSSAREEPSHD